MSADTRTVSPTTRFGGYRPASMVGAGRLIRVRAGASELIASDIAAAKYPQRLDFMDLPRSSGVQLHPTSLPGGRLGPDAYRFVDWLADAGQSWWQMLPVGPPDRHGSPYKSASAFAAWRGLLESPKAPVTREEELDFRQRNAYWIEDWARLGPRGAVADQVRFDREWGALRAHAAAT
jgi:hypothetical protein